MTASFPLDEAENKIVYLSFDLPEALPFVTHLRRTCRCLMDSLRVSDSDADDIELLIGELAANAARHAQSGGYHVNAQFFANRAVVTVIDRGAGFAPDDLPIPGSTRENDLFDQPEGRIGGFGLPLVHSLADHVAIESDPESGTTVRAEKRFRPVTLR